MKDTDTGLLLHKSDIELHRGWFKQMTQLIGINVLFRSPKDSAKTWDGHGELDALYNDPVMVGCIYEEHPKVKTMKKMGWVSELQDGSSIIHVPYDLEGLQVGALFIIPSAIDNSEGRVFRVIRMSATQVYPASIACEIAPEWADTMEKSQVEDFSSSNFNLLKEEE